MNVLRPRGTAFRAALFTPVCMALCATLLSTSALAQLKMPKDLTTPATPKAASPASNRPATPSSTDTPGPSVAPAAVPTTPAVSDAATKEEAGKLAAGGWLTLLDRRDWGRAWESTSNVFRNTVPLPAWMDNIPGLRDPLGALVERMPVEWQYKSQLAGRPDGDYVTVIFVSKFDKREPTIQEVVTTVREPDGRWRVTGYSTR